MPDSPSRTCYRYSAFATSIVVLATSIVAATPAKANDQVRDEILRRDLAVIQEQLNQVEVVVQRLEARQANSDPMTHRFYLDTDQLRRDLDRIAEGIDGYLEPPRLPPRTPIPLSGDYLKEFH